MEHQSVDINHDIKINYFDVVTYSSASLQLVVDFTYEDHGDWYTIGESQQLFATATNTEFPVKIGSSTFIFNPDPTTSSILHYDSPFLNSIGLEQTLHDQVLNVLNSEFNKYLSFHNLNCGDNLLIEASMSLKRDRVTHQFLYRNVDLESMMNIDDEYIANFLGVGGIDFYGSEETRHGWPEVPVQGLDKVVDKKAVLMGKDCVICFGEFFAGNSNDVIVDAIKLPCGHIFHGGCISKWFEIKKSQSSCPLCRSTACLTTNICSY